MKTRTFTKNGALLIAAAFVLLAGACSKIEPANPGNPEPVVPEGLKDFGFSTRKDVKLNVNYDAPEYRAVIEVYGENPVDNATSAKKQDIQPVYSFYTNEEGKYEGTITIPSSVKEVYLYTERWGLPQSVKAEFSAQGITYDASKATARAAQANGPMTRAPYAYVEGTQQPYALAGRTDGLMALGRFDISGIMEYDGFWSASPSDYTPNYISRTTQIKGQSTADLAQRAQQYFDNYTGKRSQLLKPASVTNVKVQKAGSVDLVFLAERAAFNNTIGYYYYEVGNAPTAADFPTMKKYVIMPNVEEGLTVRNGYTVRLKYFGKDGTAAASEQFPKNTVIGWFIVSNGWTLSGKIASYDANMRNYFFSDDENDNMRFVSLQDSKTGIIVLGCEDQPSRTFDREKEDYSDMLFFVKSDDGDLDNAGKPDISDEVPGTPDGNLTVSGTLAFEDIWPNGGDYDMNDVALEYKREIKFDKNNKVTSAEETFKFVQESFAATLQSWFGYQVADMGTAVLPAGCEIEQETNSIVWTVNTKEAAGKEYTVKRTFAGSVDPNKIVKDFNPYIMIMSRNANRKEVHLPGQTATAKVDRSLIGSNDDAYYMDKTGKYPFAIDIPKLNFVLSKASRPIDQTYPRFATWASSFGQTDADWYNDKPKDK